MSEVFIFAGRFSPFTQIIFVLTGILILFLSFLERPVESSIALLVVAAGIPAYFIFKKTGKHAQIIPGQDKI
jgi:hypothetical protein